MQTKKTATEKIVHRYMNELDINSIQELSRITGIDYQRLNNTRLKKPETFRVFEIRELIKALNLTDEDIINIVRG